MRNLNKITLLFLVFIAGISLAGTPPATTTKIVTPENDLGNKDFVGTWVRDRNDFSAALKIIITKNSGEYFVETIFKEGMYNDKQLASKDGKYLIISNNRKLFILDNGNLYFTGEEYHKALTKDTKTGVTEVSKQSEENEQTTKQNIADEVSVAKINWLSWDEMVKLNEKNPKNIFVDFYTAWCGWCKVMDKNTFEDPTVAEIMSKYFYCVKFDAERRDTIHFLDKDWLFIPGGRNGYHELAAYFMQNQLSYPTFCVLTPDFKLIMPLKGYIAVPQFEPIVSFLGQDFWMHSKGKNLEEYKQSYVSPRKTPWVQPQ